MQTSLDALFEKFPNRNRDDLIHILQELQNQVGYLSEDAIKQVGDFLSISENKVYGVATFYDNFCFVPKGKYHVKVCNGTGCHVCGSNNLIAELEKQLEINPGQTDKQGLFSLELVSCMGGCALAPVIDINGDYFGSLNKDQLIEIIKELREKGIDGNP